MLWVHEVLDQRAQLGFDIAGTGIFTDWKRGSCGEEFGMTLEIAEEAKGLSLMV